MALEESTRTRAPRLWALAQIDLGGVLFLRAKLEARPDLLQDAASAYRAALEELHANGPKWKAILLEDLLRDLDSWDTKSAAQ